MRECIRIWQQSIFTNESLLAKQTNFYKRVLTKLEIHVPEACQ